MTKDELLERISSEELTEWKALFIVRHKEEKEAQKTANKPKKGGRRR